MRCAEAMQAAAVGQMPPRRAARYLRREHSRSC